MLPPVRGTASASQSQPVKHKPLEPKEDPVSDKVAPPRQAAKHTYDYFDQWDKFDVDGECEKLDEVINASAADQEQDLSDEDDDEIEVDLPPELDRLTGAARKQAGVREKEIGNEYTKSSEWKKAIRHYNRSLLLETNGAVYANRALANIKQKKFLELFNNLSKSSFFST